MFKDRRDAGMQLSKALKKYRRTSTIVLAIPRGGVGLGYEIATRLHLDLSVIVTRKLPFPDNPESDFGAIAEDGSSFIFSRFTDQMPKNVKHEIIKEQKAEIKRRIEILRKGNPLPDIENRKVILTDDGIAMGSTMRASVKMCKNLGASEIIVAVPVASGHTTENFRNLVDEVIVLENPHFFQAVAQVYNNWYDVGDEEVIRILEKYEMEKQNW